VVEAPPADSAAPERGIARSRYFYGWNIVGAAGTAMFVGGALQGYGTGPFLVPMSEDLGWTRTEFILATTVGQFVIAFTAFFIGGLIDRRGARPLMLTGTVIAAIALLSTSAITELWQWIAVRGVAIAFGTALVSGLVVNVTMAKWFVERRGRAIGFMATGIALAGVVVPFLLTSLVDDFGWRATWRLFAVGVVLMMIPAAMVMRRRPEDHGLHPDGRSDEELHGAAGDAVRRDMATSLTRREALRTRTMWMLIFAFGMGGFTLLALATQTIPLLTDSGFERGTAAAMLSLFALPGLFLRPPLGLLAERVHPRYLAAGAFLCLAAGTTTIVPGAQLASTPVVATGFLLTGIGIAVLLPMQELLWATFFGRRYLGEVRGVAMPFNLVFSASGPVLVAAYFDVTGSYTGILLTMAGASVAGLAVILLVRAPRR
jgi:MFS family permease